MAHLGLSMNDAVESQIDFMQMRGDSLSKHSRVVIRDSLHFQAYPACIGTTFHREERPPGLPGQLARAQACAAATPTGASTTFNRTVSSSFTTPMKNKSRAWVDQAEDSPDTAPQSEDRRFR